MELTAKSLWKGTYILEGKDFLIRSSDITRMDIIFETHIGYS